MKTRIAQILSAAIALMGVVHIVATFTPLIDGKLKPLDHQPHMSFLYMSVMCGMLIVLCGVLAFFLQTKIKDDVCMMRIYVIIVSALSVAGILAVCFMPANPFAIVLLCLTLSLAIASFVAKSEAQ